MNKLSTKPQEIKYTQSAITEDSKKPNITIKQQLLRFPGKYMRIYDAQNHLLGVAHGKAFQLREKIYIFSDKDMKYKIGSSTTQKILDFNVTFTISGIHNKKLGFMERRGLSSEFVRDAWLIKNKSQNIIGTLMEDSKKLGIIRRFLLGFIPQKHTLKLNSGHELTIVQSFNPVILTYKIYSNNFGMIKKELGETFLIGILSTIAVIEGQQR